MMGERVCVCICRYLTIVVCEEFFEPYLLLYILFVIKIHTRAVRGASISKKKKK